MLTLKPSDYRPYKHQVNFDHRLKTQVNRFPHQKQVIFGPHSKTKSASIPTLRAKLISIQKLKPSSFRPAHKTEVDFDGLTKKQVKFDSDAKTKSISFPYVETSLFSTPSLKSSQFRSLFYYQVDFDARTQKPSYFRT